HAARQHAGLQHVERPRAACRHAFRSGPTPRGGLRPAPTGRRAQCWHWCSWPRSPCSRCRRRAPSAPRSAGFRCGWPACRPSPGWHWPARAAARGRAELRPSARGRGPGAVLGLPAIIRPAGVCRMPKLPHARVVAALAIASFGAAAREDAEVTDPHQWLEDVEGEKQLAWVREQNAKAEAELADTAGFKALEADLLAIYDSDDKIPGVYKQGDWYYNFWKDSKHERGLWRRTTLEEYRKPQPKWETVLDLDALNKAEGENWVWHGANCLRPEYA